ncbi:MAG: hypothetical protein IKH38_02270 [Clostridia bacterium]|nr:hypothetical protein [Clostridia bacterium]
MTDTYRFADVNVRITSLHPSVHALCADYRTDAAPGFAVETVQADLDRERALAERPGFADAYLETLAVYRRIAERMPEYNVFLFHGSTIAVDGTAYLFTAASGTGKSTHTRLWRRMLGDRAVMVNDDKPLIRVHPDGKATVYGTPWDGKHRLSTNIAVPLQALCILERSAENRIRLITKSEALPMLLQQTYRPASPAALDRTLVLLDRLELRFYRLGCNMDPSAAELSYNAMKEDQT